MGGGECVGWGRECGEGGLLERGEEGMEVLACVCMRVCVKVCVCMCQMRVGWQGEERGMQEVYRWAKDRSAKRGHISNIRGLVFRY